MEKVLKLKRVWALFILALYFLFPYFQLFFALNPEKQFLTTCGKLFYRVIFKILSF